jgi:hypothetical protein
VLGFAVRVAAGVGVVDTWTGPDVASKISTLFANSRNSYVPVPSVVGIATVHEPDDRAVPPAFRVQLLVNRNARYAPWGAPWTYPPIQSRVVGLATSLQLSVTVPPGATVLGFAVKVAAAAVDARAKRNTIASTILNLVTLAPSTIDHLKQGLRVFAYFHKCTTPVPSWRRRPNQIVPAVVRLQPSVHRKTHLLESLCANWKSFQKLDSLELLSDRRGGRLGEAYVAALRVSLFLCEWSLATTRKLCQAKNARPSRHLGLSGLDVLMCRE